MARNRTIKPTFWSDVKIGELKRDARLLYIGLWNFADDCGVVSADSRFLKASIFPFDDIRPRDIDDWLKSLETSGMIVPIVYDGKSYYAIPNFGKHQVVCRPNIKMANVPPDILAQLVDAYTPVSLDAEPQQRTTKEEVVEVDEFVDEATVSYNKFVEWCKANAPTVLKVKRPISKEEFVKLRDKYGGEKVGAYLQKMDNWVPLTKKCASAYRTIINWIERDEQDNKTRRGGATSSRPQDASISTDYKESILRRMVGGEGNGQI